MLNTEKLDRLQKRLEFWDRPGNPITVNDGLELVALARKGLEAQRLETLANGYKVASEEAQEIMAEQRTEVERLNKEADWLAGRLKEACKSLGCLDCPFYDDEADYCLYDEKPWREAAREAVEASHAE